MILALGLLTLLINYSHERELRLSYLRKAQEEEVVKQLNDSNQQLSAVALTDASALCRASLRRQMPAYRHQWRCWDGYTGGSTHDLRCSDHSRQNATRLHARAEYEYVGHKFLDVGNPDHSTQYEAVPVNETRIAVVRSFLDGRLEVGADGLIADGYTGQATETFDPAWNIVTSRTALPYCAAGSGPSRLASDFDCGTVERAVGIRMVSFTGGSISWRFGSRN